MVILRNKFFSHSSQSCRDNTDDECQIGILKVHSGENTPSLKIAQDCLTMGVVGGGFYEMLYLKAEQRGLCHCGGGTIPRCYIPAL